MHQGDEEWEKERPFVQKTAENVKDAVDGVTPQGSVHLSFEMHLLSGAGKDNLVVDHFVSRRFLNQRDKPDC